MILEELRYWRDPVPRTGPENMAVDECLLETEEKPVLRVYDWAGKWVSLGYFGRREQAETMMAEDGLQLVRRATGGGIVDHRIDFTYSLVVPPRFDLAKMGGADSYRVIHAALASALRMLGADALSIEEDAESDSAVCFEKPVTWDLVDSAGRKLAGAGQRRTKSGLLHQGSVVTKVECAELFDTFADQLATTVETIRREPSGEDLAAMIEKFESREWLERR